MADIPYVNMPPTAVVTESEQRPLLKEVPMPGTPPVNCFALRTPPPPTPTPGEREPYCCIPQ